MLFSLQLKIYVISAYSISRILLFINVEYLDHGAFRHVTTSVKGWLISKPKNINAALTLYKKPHIMLLYLQVLHALNSCLIRKHLR